MSIKSLLRRRKYTLYLYGDESGDLASAPFFALGVLVTKDPDKHGIKINNLRREHQYHNELKYSKTDRYQLPFAEAVLQYFLREHDLRFTARLVDNSQHDLAHFEKFETDYHRQDVAYNWHYKKLLVRATPPRAEMVVHLDDRQRRNEDNLPEYLKNEFPSMKSLQLVDSSRHQLVQVADLLTGCLFGDATRSTHPVKRGAIDALKDGLGVGSLLERRLARDEKYCVDCWRPPSGT